MACFTAASGHSSAEMQEELRKRSVMLTGPKSDLGVCVCVWCLKYKQALDLDVDVCNSLCWLKVMFCGYVRDRR